MTGKVEIDSSKASSEGLHDTFPGRAAEWRAVQRVASNEIFAKSEFLPKFLLYICDRQLRGKTAEITEQQIGERVFGRPAAYDRGDDNIVRNYASQLRKRLEAYYEGEGKEDDIRISVPRGGYVPVFVPRNTEAVAFKTTVGAPDTDPGEARRPDAAESAPVPAASAPLERTVRTRRPDWVMLLLGCLLGAFILGAVLVVHRYQSRPASTPSHPLWSEVFSNERDTFVVPADSGLGILQNLTGQPVTVADYASGKYLSDLKSQGIDVANLEDLRTQRYTSIADLSITSRLVRIPEAISGRFVIRYARDLRMDDLRNGNAILLGAIHTDPWEDLLQQQLNFQIVCKSQVNDCSIINKRPAPGEKQSYESNLKDPAQETYAIVAFLPNLSRTGHVLIIGGLNMAGTEAAANILLDDTTMHSVIQKATLPDGSLRPFELLIGTGSLGSEALPSRIIASRIGT